MDLTPAERSNLASFYAKRFPDPTDRSELARAAAIVEPSTPVTSARAAWDRLLADAEDAGRLARLAHAAADRDPDDANLRRAALLIGPAPSVWPKLALATAAVGVPVLAVLAVGVVALSVGAFDTAPANAAPRATASPSVAVVAPADAPDGPAVVATETPAEAADDAVPAARPVEDEPAEPPADAPIAATTPHTADSAPVVASARPANDSGRCTLSGGGLIGYWYAGTESPGTVGQTLTVDSAMNVRGHVPSVSNHFDARGPIRCVLVKGDRVRLSHAPVPVPVGSFWVPLYSGDVVSEGR